MKVAGLEKRAFVTPGAITGAVEGSSDGGPGFGKGLVQGH